MKMALRACVYMNCQNYVLDKVPSSTFTLFQFPKNPERRKKWMELGRAPNNLPPSTYYYCSDHFDKKYLAVNQRRTILVGEALPFEYVDSEVVDKDDSVSIEDGDDEYILYEMKDEQLGNQEQDFHIESTMQEDEHGNLLNTNENNLEETLEFTREIIDDSEENNLKRKSYTNYVHIKRAKKSKTSNDSNKPGQGTSLQQNVTPDTENLTDERIIQEYLCCSDVNDLIDSKVATTFIFKGEEYIQMPKQSYLEEKLMLIEKIQKLENVLQSIRKNINAYDLLQK